MAKSRHGFLKRQKEQARREKKKAKAERLAAARARREAGIEEGEEFAISPDEAPAGLPPGFAPAEPVAAGEAAEVSDEEDREAN